MILSYLDGADSAERQRENEGKIDRERQRETEGDRDRERVSLTDEINPTSEGA